LDLTDYKILSLLRENSRTPLKELATIADVSIPTARSRIMRLQDLGVIKKLTVSIDLQTITNQVTSYIALKTKLPNIKEIVSEFKKFDEVSEAYLTTGQFDIILKIQVPDMNSVDKFVTEKLRGIEGIETVHSSFVMENIKEFVGPTLRPNFGFKIDCETCGNKIGEKYSRENKEGVDYLFCSEACLSAFTRKS
jgi:DNA-binding Lrp family transcriptional regulator